MVLHTRSSSSSRLKPQVIIIIIVVVVTVAKRKRHRDGDGCDRPAVIPLYRVGCVTDSIPYIIDLQGWIAILLDYVAARRRCVQHNRPNVPKKSKSIPRPPSSQWSLGFYSTVTQFYISTVRVPGQHDTGHKKSFIHGETRLASATATMKQKNDFSLDTSESFVWSRLFFYTPNKFKNCLLMELAVCIEARKLLWSIIANCVL